MACGKGAILDFVTGRVYESRSTKDNIVKYSKCFKLCERLLFLICKQLWILNEASTNTDEKKCIFPIKESNKEKFQQ